MALVEKFLHHPLAGAYDDEVPPVPIPNTEVKLISAENTWREAAREHRSVPAPQKFDTNPPSGWYQSNLNLFPFYTFLNGSIRN